VAEPTGALAKIANRSCQADPLEKIANRSCQADPLELDPTRLTRLTLETRLRPAEKILDRPGRAAFLSMPAPEFNTHARWRAM